MPYRIPAREKNSNKLRGVATGGGGVVCLGSQRPSINWAIWLFQFTARKPHLMLIGSYTYCFSNCKRSSTLLAISCYVKSKRLPCLLNLVHLLLSLPDLNFAWRCINFTRKIAARRLGCPLMTLMLNKLQRSSARKKNSLEIILDFKMQ